MAAEQFGRRLQGEVREESLDELLRDLRAQLNPTPKDVLGIESLDRLLEISRYPQATTPTRRPGWRVQEGGSERDSPEAEHYEPSPPTRPPIIELTSSHSAAGKTTLLYYLAAKAVLPVSHGGQASLVLWIDADGRFDVSRLKDVVLSYLTANSSKTATAGGAPSTSSISADGIATQSLKNLHLMSPNTSTQLLGQLAALPFALMGLASPLPLSLLVLDSATAFTHQDRFDADLARLEAGGVVGGADHSSTRGATATAQLSKTAQLITALKALQSRFECAVIFTTAPPAHPTTTFPYQQHRVGSSNNSTTAPPLPDARSVSAWTQFATLTLTLSRQPIARFATQMSLEECLRDREKRQEAVAAGRFVGAVIAVDGRGRGVRDAVEGVEGQGRARVGIVIKRAEGGGLVVEVA